MKFRTGKFVVIATALTLVSFVLLQSIWHIFGKTGASVGHRELRNVAPFADVLSGLSDKTVFYWQSLPHRHHVVVGFACEFDDAVEWAGNLSNRSMQTSDSPPIGDIAELPEYIWSGELPVTQNPYCKVSIFKIVTESHEVEISIYETPSFAVLKGSRLIDSD
ncbi:hypothetical protein [Rhodopirellula bahusiensis]|uniref:hypothetical protein n=1 Tax=Rhodopirellula bahusiensis TaxID=2014065 RepID=UPI003266A1C5